MSFHLFLRLACTLLDGQYTSSPVMGISFWTKHSDTRLRHFGPHTFCNIKRLHTSLAGGPVYESANQSTSGHMQLCWKRKARQLGAGDAPRQCKLGSRERNVAIIYLITETLCVYQIYETRIVFIDQITWDRSLISKPRLQRAFRLIYNFSLD